MGNEPEIYVSTDVEADGPIPGVNSMLSFGSAAYLADKTPVSTFSANLETLAGAVSDPKTMEWWRGRPEAWVACRENLQAPEKAMKDYLAWLKGLPGIPVFVGYPAAYDFLFVYWYLIRFTGESPFSHSALDIKTFAMALMKTPYRQSTKKNMPKEWYDKLPHSHKALDDAIEQGALFCNMLAEWISMESTTPFDELIGRLNKSGSAPKARLIASFIGEIKVIYLLMQEVSRSWAAICETLPEITKILISGKWPNSRGGIDNKIKLMGPDLTIRTRLFYSSLVSTIVSYGEKSELIRKKIPNYYRIKMFRNTMSAHWKDYIDIPPNGSSNDSSKLFSIPNYVKENFQVSEVNAIFKKYTLDISINDQSLLVENIYNEFDRIYEAFEKKWGEKLNTHGTELGRLISELSHHLLIIPINNLKKFFENLAKQFNKENFELTTG